MIPSNYHHVVRYATYSYSSQNQIPDNLRVTEDIQVLSVQNLPKFSLVKEYELIAQYSDWISSQKSKKVNETKTSSSPNSYDLSNIQSQLPNVKDAVVVGSASVGPVPFSYNSSNYALPSLSPPANSVVPSQQPTAGNPSNVGSNNEYLVLRMMQETGQDRDICYFLLESVNWDFNQAMEIMMQNLQVK